MQPVYGVTPSIEHYVCMVDVYGRSGLLDKAENFINKLEKPDVLLYKALLGACRIHNDLNRAERIGAAILARTPRDAATYILLYNIYAANNMWEKALEIRNRMESLGLKKIPGQSTIVIGDTVHRFLVEDKSHPETKQIYASLDDLYMMMKAEGYKPDLASALKDTDDKSKEIHLCYHR
jgi:pentatricopeptide repeat protein